MNLLHYIDNEVPWNWPADCGEWDTVSKTGSSTIGPSADAAFDERGFMGLRFAGDADGNTASVFKAFGAGNETLALGLWLRAGALPTNGSYSQSIRVNAPGLGDLFTGRVLKIDESTWRVGVYAKEDDGSNHYMASSDLSVDRWYYVVFLAHSGSGDGWFKLYVDGVEDASATSLDNDARVLGAQFLYLGNQGWGYHANAVYDFDEIKIATEYPEPCVPAPADEYPSATRMVVLYRQASSDSREFADYCVEELGVPRCNLIGLPNASANETLADYAAFGAEVEDGIADYFALNPTVAANCTCFLIGYGVPGYFTHGGIRHSAASRLMNYGTAFSSGAANPLYNPATVQRLSKTALGGKYLAARIDAATLAAAKAIVDRGLAVWRLAVLAEADKLYSDDADYIASLPCQRLRIVTGGMAQFADDAFVFGDTGTPSFSFGTAGSRAAFVDTSAEAAESLRSGSSPCRTALLYHYAAAVGSAETAETLDAESFFEMLRIGGTFAEAVAVATEKLDYTAVPAGNPLMTVAFCLGGYNVYRGVGGPEAIDWEQPIAYMRQDTQVATVPLAISAGEKHILAVRAVSPAGTEERNTHVLAYAEVDAGGSLLPPPLLAPSDLTAEVQSDASVVVGFNHHAPPGYTTATEFDIFSDAGTGTLNLQTPVASIYEVRPQQIDFEVVLMPPVLPVKLAVRASSDERPGPLSRIITVANVRAPAAPALL